MTDSCRETCTIAILARYPATPGKIYEVCTTVPKMTKKVQLNELGNIVHNVVRPPEQDDSLNLHKAHPTENDLTFHRTLKHLAALAEAQVWPQVVGRGSGIFDMIALES